MLWFKISALGWPVAFFLATLCAFMAAKYEERLPRWLGEFLWNLSAGLAGLMIWLIVTMTVAVVLLWLGGA